MDDGSEVSYDKCLIATGMNLVLKEIIPIEISNEFSFYSAV